MIVEYVDEYGVPISEEDFENNVPVYPMIGHRTCYKGKQQIVEQITWHMDKCPATSLRGRVIRIHLKVI